ncbi:MAG TPA: hypothetical protein VNX21_06815, partial [Candidatus Thermoplasmatota archaeon]|nr:hypothetical protein [Candidatus Thermoplasmatota archaeon]
MRTLLIALLALAALPVAAAQEPDRPTNDDASQDAWVKDCPPDMMCAYGTGDGAEENATYKGDCGGEVCATQERPNPYGPEGCVECSGPAPDQGSTCMDGAEAGEGCRDDVQYLDGGRGPPLCENCRGEEADPISAPADGAPGDGGVTSVDESAATNDVPLPALLVVFAALAAAVLVVRRA